MQKTIWFKAKPYGFGWYPATWQGWLITFGCIAFVIIAFLSVDRGSHSGSDTLFGVFPYFVVLTCLLLLVARWKGEKFGWRWRRND